MPPGAAPQTSALRRLRRILTDEDYGPKLVRLSRADQRTVLDLIDENRGREARSAIDRLDAVRVEQEEAHRRQTLHQKVVAALYALHGPSTEGQANRIWRNAQEFTAAQMRRVLSLTGQKLRNYVLPRAAQPAPAGNTINPFWYR